MIRFRLTDNSERLNFNLDSDKDSVTFQLSSRGNVQPYTGETTVIPDFDQHILETANKLVSSDITVERIPVNEAINEAGGYTVWIGGL